MKSSGADSKAAPAKQEIDPHGKPNFTKFFVRLCSWKQHLLLFCQVLLISSGIRL